MLQAMRRRSISSSLGALLTEEVYPSFFQGPGPMPVIGQAVSQQYARTTEKPMATTRTVLFSTAMMRRFGPLESSSYILAKYIYVLRSRCSNLQGTPTSGN